MPGPTPPTHLGKSARKLWRDIVGSYDLRADELRILESACREVDLVELIEKEMRADGFELIVAGSMGQPVENPLVKEVRQHRMAMKNLLVALKIPDEGAAQERTTSARAAANARWGRAS